MSDPDVAARVPNVARPGLSIVVPAFNEVACVPLLVSELLPEAALLNAEIIVVDDGSTDGTAAELQKHPEFRCFSIRRSGKSAALEYGVRQARARIVVTMDADLQEDPRQITDLLRVLDGGADLAIGRRTTRSDGLLTKRIPSLVFRVLVCLLFFRHFRDINCGFRAARREVFRHVPWFAGSHRLIPLLVAQAGGKVLEIPVRHRRRRCGQPKFQSPVRFFEGIRDLLRIRLGFVSTRAARRRGRTRPA